MDAACGKGCPGHVELRQRQGRHLASRQFPQGGRFCKTGELLSPRCKPGQSVENDGTAEAWLARPLQAFSPDPRLGLVSLRRVCWVRMANLPPCRPGFAPESESAILVLCDRAGTRRLGWESPTHGVRSFLNHLPEGLWTFIYCRADDATRRDGNRSVVRSFSCGGRDEAQRLATGDRRQRTAPVSPREAAASRVLSWFSSATLERVARR